MDKVEIIKEISKFLHIEWFKDHTILLITAIVVLIFPHIIRVSKYIYRVLQKNKLNKNLKPYFSSIETEKATKFYIPTKCQNVDPSRELEPEHTHAFATKEKLIPFFLKKAFKDKKTDQKFYIILADSGMGKTTFMLNLYLRYSSKHFGKIYEIKLLPLGAPDVDEAIENIKEDEKKNTILLLDAFDEDNKAILDYKKRLGELINIIWKFAIVVITCRTQFFPSEIEEPMETGIMKYGGEKGEHIFRKIYISPFDDDDIKKYLRKKYSFFRLIKKLRAKGIIKRSSNLIVRPMLLSYIDDLLESKKAFTYSVEVYEELIKRWIDRESNRVPLRHKDNFKIELMKFSNAIALNMYNKRSERKWLFVEADQMISIAATFDIKLEDFEMKSQSLLNRNAQGQYKFSHKSILEYFIAFHLFTNEFDGFFTFDGIQQAERFFAEFISVNFRAGGYRRPMKHEYSIDGSTWFDFYSIKLSELKKIKFLKLFGFYDMQIEFIQKMKNLELLMLSWCNIESTEFLSVFRNLETLDLHHNRISNVDTICNLTRLTKLDLSNNNISVLPNSISNLKKLSILELSRNNIQSVNALAKLQYLKQIDLMDTQVSESELAKLKRSLPKTRITHSIIQPS